jgi:PPOX class probable F420-dependent enzyme
MRKLVGDEWKSFVLAEPRPAICAIVLSDGRPHATPIWIDLDGDDIVFTTWHEGLKAKVLPRDPRVSICVQDDQPPFAYVTIRGEATVTDDLAAVKVWAARIGGRYMGADRAGEYGRKNGVQGELVVRVRPTKVVGFVEMAGPAVPS